MTIILDSTSMPYKVVKKPVKSSKKDWAIINKNSGRIVGRSTSKKKAEASVRARYANE
jgi:hypothetical protein